MIARRIVVTGRVQGVGFRFHIEAAARAERVNGWVCNRADGSVEALLVGTPEAVARVESAVGRGPRLARVESMTVTDESVPGDLAGFRVRSDG